MHGASLVVEHVVVHGSSAGARLGGIVLTTPNEPAFQDDNLWPGVSDAPDGFIGFYGYYDGTQFAPAAYYGGTTPASAITTDRASSASGPAYLVHGDADSLIPASQSQDLADALQSAGKEVELLVPTAAGHGFDVVGTNALTSEGNTEAIRVLAWLDSRYG